MSRVLVVLVVLVGVVAVAEARPKQQQKSDPVEVAPAPPPEADAEAEGDELLEEMPPHQTGPVTVDLGEGIEIDLPAGAILFERTVARAMLEESGENPDDVLAIVVPAGDEPWSLSIDWSGVGHVSDADAGKLDAREMLAQMDRGTRAQNVVRRAKHVSELFVDGWSTEPRYQRDRRALTWGVKLHSDEGPLLNEFTNVLGRHGYVGLDLIAAPADIEAARVSAAPAMAGIHFKSGHRYEEFDPRTDRDSGMNLRNLVVGAGVVAAGSKLGVFAAIAVVLKKIGVAIAAAAAGLWKWLTGRRKKDSLAEG